MPASDQGSLSGRYSFIPRTLVFLTCGEQMLLLKGAANKRLWSGKYNGIGGHLERGEDPYNSARREVLEETGLQVEDLWLCGLITIDAGKEAGILIFVLRGEVSAGTIAPSSEGTPEWHTFEESLTLHLVEDLPLVLPVVLSKKRTDPPFLAHYHYTPEGELNIKFLQK
jgi:8-oxo-dGTP diphosphatase